MHTTLQIQHVPTAMIWQKMSAKLSPSRFDVCQIKYRTISAISHQYKHIIQFAVEFQIQVALELIHIASALRGVGSSCMNVCC